MSKKVSLAAAVALATVLTACGGGSSSSDNGSGSGNNGGGGTTPASASVAGPLDPVQSAVTTTVISPLVGAAAGTPLQGVLLCANSVVTMNTLDIADAFANGLQNPATLASTTPAQAQAAVTALVAHLSGLLNSLASTSLSGSSCGGGAAGSTQVPTSNPLASTPLAALGDQLLPVLLSAQQQLGGSSTPLSATQLAGIVSSISAAFDRAVASLPSEATGAPIVGGVIAAVQNALAQLSTIATDASSGANPTVIAADLQALASSVLNSLLTQVLPVADLQSLAGAGAGTDVLATLQAAIASLTSGLATNPTTTLPSDPLSGVGFDSLTTLLSTFVPQLQTILGGAGTVSSPLDLATTLVQDLLGSLLSLGGSGGSGGSGSGCLLQILGLCLPAP